MGGPWCGPLVQVNKESLGHIVVVQLTEFLDLQAFHFGHIRVPVRYVIKAAGLSKSFENKTIFRQADLSVQYGEKTALIGPNGCGKTTFLKLLLGEQAADDGEVILGANVRMAYLPQNLAFEDEELTILDYFREDISILEGKAREQLAKFMFCGATVFKKIRLLSGGEKVRLKLSKLLLSDINLLILDEPTNHLDTASIESIEQALLQFKGTIFFISHDRYFINKICDRVIAVENQEFRSYSGNYDDYKNEKEKQAAQSCQSSGIPATEVVHKPGKNGKADNQDVNERQKNIRQEKVMRTPTPEDKATNKDKNTKKDKAYQQEKGSVKDKTGIKITEASEMESRIKTLEKEMKEIESAMEKAGSDYEELNRLYTRKEELGREMDSTMELWVNS
jgi:ABC-type multidrug transport system ATPase subunit